eukprot:scaffold915_cov65-Cylindrotheca_fusiformis.AAC.6
MAMDCSSDDEFFLINGEQETSKEPSSRKVVVEPTTTATKEVIVVEEEEEDDTAAAAARGTTETVLGSSARQRRIEREVGEFCKRAGEEELDKEMRNEGIKALKIAAEKFAYKKKYYDSTNDTMIVYPSVAGCLAGYDVYEEAEKHYYDPEDEYPLKYTAALRDLALAAGGGEEDTQHMDTMSMDCSSDDEFF